MKTKLIILRGNSGSGKTTTALALQSYFGEGTLLVSQDVIRREMLLVKDRKGNLSLDLIRQITEYGKGKCRYVILEGIFTSSRYREMLLGLIHYFEDNADTYYFDLSFEETVRRHSSRDKSGDFGEDSLREWWNPKDYLGVVGETNFTDDMTKEDIFRFILEQAEQQKISLK